MISTEQEIRTLGEIKPLLSKLLDESSEQGISLDWLSQLPASAVEVLDHLAQRSDQEVEAWQREAASEDPELALLVQRLLSTPFKDLPEEASASWVDHASVFKFADRITDVEFSAHISLELENPRPIIRLVFLAGEGSDQLAFTSDQDLEDTLHIGRAVFASVEETLELAHEHGYPLRVEQFGNNFEQILAQTEESIRSLRRFYGRAKGRQKTPAPPPDTPSDAPDTSDTP